MRINLTDFYDVGKIEFWRTSTNVPMYEIELISKSTGEVITWSFTEEYFDKLLDEMEGEAYHKQCMLNNMPMLRYYFAVGRAYEQANKKETN